MTQIGTLSLKFVGDARDLNRTFTGIGVKANLLSSAIEASFKTAGKAALSFIKSSVEIAAQNESTLTSFQNLTGSLGTARDLYEDLIDTAARTPFEVSQYTSAAKTLLGFGQTADQTKRSIDFLSAAAAAGGGALQSMAINFGQISAAGKASARDLREFINQGIPINQLLADIGKEGSKSFADIREAFENAISEGGRLENTLAAQSKTFEGLASTVRSQVNIALGELGTAVLPAARIAAGRLIERMDDLLEFFKSNEFQQGAAKVSAALIAAFESAGTEIEIEFRNMENVLLQFAQKFQSVATGLANSTLGSLIFSDEDIANSNSNAQEIADRLVFVRERLDELQNSGNRFGDIYGTALAEIQSEMERLATATSDYGTSSNRTWDDSVEGVSKTSTEIDVLTQKILALNNRLLDTDISAAIGNTGTISDEDFQGQFVPEAPPVPEFDTLTPGVEEIDAEALALLRLAEAQKVLADNTQLSSEAASTFGSEYAKATGEGKKGLIAFAAAAANTARQVISATIAQGVAKAAASALENVPFPLNIILAGVAAGAAKALFDSIIPSFHDGGRMPHDGLALLHQGEIITNPALGQRPPGLAVQRVNISGITSGPDWAWMNANAGQLGRLINGPG